MYVHVHEDEDVHGGLGLRPVPLKTLPSPPCYTPRMAEREGLVSKSTLALIAILAVYAVSYIAYLGGPLAVGQAMADTESNQYAIVFVTVTPLFLLAWGVLTAWQSIADGVSKIGIYAGALGAVALLGMTLYGFGNPASRVPEALEYRVPALVLGLGYPAIFGALAYRFLKPRTD